MQTQTNSRRPAGAGALWKRRDQGGKLTWYAKWRAGGRQVQRALGPVKVGGDSPGLTKRDADRRLRALMDEDAATPLPDHRVTVKQAGERLIKRLEAKGRKPSTIQDYTSYLDGHLAPSFPETLDRITRRDVEAFMVRTLQDHSPKSVRNYLGLLHSVFEYAMREGWVSANPCKLVDKPVADDGDADIAFLELEEVEALIEVAPADPVGRVERVVYLTAAMSGMRQAELLALRWRDVDWQAGRIRVRRNYVRGKYGTPKSKRSSRSVPMHDRVGGELERLFQSSPFKGDDDLVFAHPATGGPMDRSKLHKRYVKAVKRAKVRKVRFHDLRHTFATQMAKAGVPMRTLQEWMGHRDFKTTLIYADYAPSEHEAEWVERAFAVVPAVVPNLTNSDQLEPTQTP